MKNSGSKSKMGRPTKDLDWEKVKHLMQYRPTLEDASAFFDISKTTLEDKIKAEFDVTFREFRAKHMAKTRILLVQKAIQKALQGDNCMLIFALKNFCGWTDAPTPDSGDEIDGLEFVS